MPVIAFYPFQIFPIILELGVGQFSIQQFVIVVGLDQDGPRAAQGCDDLLRRPADIGGHRKRRFTIPHDETDWLAGISFFPAMLNGKSLNGDISDCLRNDLCLPQSTVPFFRRAPSNYVNGRLRREDRDAMPARQAAGGPVMIGVGVGDQDACTICQVVANGLDAALKLSGRKPGIYEEIGVAAGNKGCIAAAAACQNTDREGHQRKGLLGTDGDISTELLNVISAPNDNHLIP